MTNSPQGFKDDSNGTFAGDPSDDYTYDLNGNMTADENKIIKTISYNHLNLPKRIVLDTGLSDNIQYFYDATGIKLKKIVTDVRNNTVTTTEYLHGFQYKNNVLQFFPTAEGYVNSTLVNGSNTYNYVYNYADHLGNIRLSYTKDPTTGTLKIIEENHNYPFGLKHNYNTTDYQFTPSGSGLVLSQVGENGYNYQYNGKEYQDELGLDWYDYGARNYDASLGRWMNLDPLTEEYPSYSPYVYVYNNPLKFIDPTGMEGVADYFTINGKYLGNDGVDDKRVMIVQEGTYKENEEGGYSIKNSGISELKDGLGNAVNIDTFTYLASVLYAEGANTWEESAGIFSVLENRAVAEGTSIKEQASVENGVFGASSEDRKKYSMITASNSQKENANKGVILGLTTSTDYSNGAYFWDGTDYASTPRYKGGTNFTDASHNIYKLKENKGAGSNSFGTWSSKYETTNAQGKTVFSRLTLEWRQSRHSTKTANWAGLIK